MNFNDETPRTEESLTQALSGMRWLENMLTEAVVIMRTIKHPEIPSYWLSRSATLDWIDTAISVGKDGTKHIEARFDCYVGGGEYESGRIEFPLSWLTADDMEAAIQADADVRAAKAEQERLEARQRKDAEAKDRRRAMYLHLQKEFDNGQ